MSSKFKRSINNKVTNSIDTLAWICLLVGSAVYLILSYTSDQETNSSLYWLAGGGIIWFISLIAALIATRVILPDFEYTIRIVENDKEKFIIFEFSEDNHQKLDVRFAIAFKDKRSMTLDDGYARINIAYDKEVVEFLNKVKE